VPALVLLAIRWLSPSATPQASAAR
jgi:hypothetical protein